MLLDYLFELMCGLAQAPLWLRLQLPSDSAPTPALAVGAARIWLPATDLYKFSGRSTQVPVV